MKKRIVAAILAAAMALALVACGEPQPLTEEDLSFVFAETGNTAITIGMTAEEIEKNFDVSVEELRNWEGGVVFAEFGALYSQMPDSPQDTATGAVVNGENDKLMTPRGIKAGDTMDAVIAAYGEPTLTALPYMIYAREGLSGGLLFDISGDKTSDNMQTVRNILIKDAAFVESYISHLEGANSKGDR